MVYNFEWDNPEFFAGYRLVSFVSQFTITSVLRKIPVVGIIV